MSNSHWGLLQTVCLLLCVTGYLILALANKASKAIPFTKHVAHITVLLVDVFNTNSLINM